MSTEGLHPVPFRCMMSSSYEVYTLLSRTVYRLFRYLPCHVEVGTAAGFPRSDDQLGLGVGAAERSMPPFADDGAVSNRDRADGRIW